jgi:hypothetical protein
VCPTFSSLQYANAAFVLVPWLLCYLQVSQLLCAKEQLEFDVAAQQAQADELAATLDALRAQVTTYVKTSGACVCHTGCRLLNNEQLPLCLYKCMVTAL